MPILIPNEHLLLIVDDLPKNLQILGTILRGEGYNVAAATSGNQALSILENSLPDLILLDIMMPELNGYEVCEKLKIDAATSNIPVIFLTAKNEIEDKIKGFEVGAVDFISKPFDHAELLARIQTHLELKKSRDLIEEMNKSLRAQTRELKKLNEEKNEFLQIVAHDLKNPLHNIQLLTQELNQASSTNTNESKQHLCAQIFNNADRMLTLIKNFLNINAIEEGKITIRKEIVDLNKIVNSVIQNNEEYGKQKRIKIQFSSDNNYTINSDKDALAQIIDNLLSNAIKYSPFEKNIFISVFSECENFVFFKVEDQGPGIKEEEAERLFKKFSRLSTRPTGGEFSNGLGLSIAKQLVNQLNGNIWCEIYTGKGGVFVVQLPV